ncbi:hypothetical protein QYE76_062447 [Lolium multiflorum]|uniref:Uncharacterized protein n=1 Tax=Lolium multiflorum TaxID=4521 RepID=A0AAD8W8F5_LOLMU|nr:hypothetical protein QYE76_062447 [Lolium multiflorum]
MFASRPAVHPVEAPPPTDPVGQPTGVLMKDLPGMHGTAGGLGLRIAQFAFAGVALVVMASTNDSPSISAFCRRRRTMMAESVVELMSVLAPLLVLLAVAALVALALGGGGAHEVEAQVHAQATEWAQFVFSSSEELDQLAA